MKSFKDYLRESVESDFQKAADTYDLDYKKTGPMSHKVGKYTVMTTSAEYIIKRGGNEIKKFSRHNSSPRDVVEHIYAVLSS